MFFFTLLCATDLDKTALLKRAYEIHQKIADTVQNPALPEKTFFRAVWNQNLLYCPILKPKIAETPMGAFIHEDKTLWVVMSPNQGLNQKINPFLDYQKSDEINDVEFIDEFSVTLDNYEVTHQYRVRKPYSMVSRELSHTMLSAIIDRLGSFDSIIFTGIGQIAGGLAHDLCMIIMNSYKYKNLKPMIAKLVVYGPHGYAFDQAGFDALYSIIGKENCLFVDIKDQLTQETENNIDYERKGLIKAISNYQVDTIPMANWDRDTTRPKIEGDDAPPDPRNKEIIKWTEAMKAKKRAGEDYTKELLALMNI